MEITISVLKDAAEAFKTSTEGLEKLVNMVRSQVAAGAEFMDKRAARRVKQQLEELTAQVTFETGYPIAFFVPTIMTFVNNPTVANWTKVKEEIATVSAKLDEIGRGLRAVAPAIAAQEFFEAFVEGLELKRAAVTRLASIEMPNSREERQALAEFAEQYDRLIQGIKEANRQFKAYLRD